MLRYALAKSGNAIGMAMFLAWPALVYAQEQDETGLGPAIFTAIQVVLTLLVVIGLMLAALWIIRKIESGEIKLLRPRREPPPMRVTQALSLGRKERLVRVEVDGQILVLGVTEHSIAILTNGAVKKASDEGFKSFVSALSASVKAKKRERPGASNEHDRSEPTS